MKKLSGLILFLFCATFSFAQSGFPNNQTISNSATLYHAKGGLMGDSGLVILRFPDTATANLGPYIKNTDGIMITIGQNLFIRYLPLYKWVGFPSSGGGGSFGIDSLTFHNDSMCIHAAGLTNCYPLGSYYDSTALNSDSTYQYHYSRGVFIDSSWVPKSPIFADGGNTIVDTSVIINGDTIRAFIVRGNGGSGGSQTWQQTLDVGSATNKDNTVEAGNNFLKINNTSQWYVTSTNGAANAYDLISAGQLGFFNQRGLANATGGTNDLWSIPSSPTTESSQRGASYTYSGRVYRSTLYQYPNRWVFNNSAGDSLTHTRVEISSADTLPTAPTYMWVANGDAFAKYPITGGGAISDTSLIGVLDSLNTPPVSPNTGDVYEVGTVPTGAWVGHAKAIATWGGASWSFDPTSGLPATGLLLLNGANYLVSKFNGTVWVRVGRSVIYNGPINYGVPVAIGTSNAVAVTLNTNNVQRLAISGAGAITFPLLTGAGTVNATLSPTGVLARGIAPTPDSAIWKTSATYWNGSQTLTMGNNTQSFRGNKVNFDSTNIGTAGTLVGINYLQPFTGVTIPTNVTATAPNATISYSNKVIVSGGTANGANYLEFTTPYNNYDKQKVSVIVVPQDRASTATNGIGLTQASNAAFFSTSYDIRWNLSSGVDSGRASFNGVYSPNSYFSIGDTMICEWERDGWQQVVSILNKRTLQRTFIPVNTNQIGTGGKMRLVFYGGSQHILAVNVESFNLKNTGIAIAGDSHGTGSGATIESNAWVNLLMGMDKYRFSNYSHPSITALQWIISDWPNLKAQNPQYVIEALGYNDRRDLVDDSTAFKLRIIPILDSFALYNITPILTTLIPTTAGVGSATDKCSQALQNLAISRGLKIADVRAALLNGGTSIYKNYLCSDGVHLSDSGNMIYMNVVRQVSNEAYNLFIADTASPIKMINPPVGNVGMPLLTINSKGYIYQVPNNNPTEGTFLSNYYNRGYSSASAGYSGGSAQRNSALYVDGVVKTDSAVQVPSGRFGFHNGSSSNTDNNLDFTNGGLSGFSNVQGYDVFGAGASGNLIMKVSSAAKLKAALLGTYNGNNNTIINSLTGTTHSGSNDVVVGSTLFTGTSGSGRIGMGLGALKGVTTASEIIDFDFNGLGPSFNTANSIFFGSNQYAFNNDIRQAGDIGWALTAANPNFWFGGRASGETVTLNFTGPLGGTNAAGLNAFIRSSRGTGTGIPGSMLFQTWNVVGSGSTWQSTPNTELTIAPDLLTVDAALTINGNVSLNTAGNKLFIATGSNASVGTATLSGGTVTVSTTAVTASSKIFLTDATTGVLTNIGTPTVGTIVAGTSFVINSTNVLDGSSVNWLIIN